MLRRRMLYGKDLKFNQLIENGNFANGIRKWAIRSGVNYSINNNILHIDGSSSVTNAVFMWQTPKVSISNHKYLGVAKVKGSQYHFSLNNAFGLVYTSFIDPSSSYIQYSQIATEATGANDKIFRVQFNGAMINEAYLDVTNIMVIDLTSMYGVGNEPTDVETVKADCASIGHPLTEYQPYTPIS